MLIFIEKRAAHSAPLSLFKALSERKSLGIFLLGKACLLTTGLHSMVYGNALEVWRLCLPKDHIRA